MTLYFSFFKRRFASFDLKILCRTVESVTRLAMPPNNIRTVFDSLKNILIFGLGNAFKLKKKTKSSLFVCKISCFLNVFLGWLPVPFLFFFFLFPAVGTCFNLLLNILILLPLPVFSSTINFRQPRIIFN